MRPPPRTYLAIALAAFGAGCDEGPPAGPIPVHPVNGRVQLKGRPLPDALVIFHRESDAGKSGGAGANPPPTPTGRTDAEGQFRIHTYNGDDGAPAGSYNVTVVPASSGENRNLMAKNAARGLRVAIPRKYADPAQSGLSATVLPGENPVISLDLK